MSRCIHRLVIILSILCGVHNASAQIDVAHVVSIGRNALHFNDYVVSIGYFNRAIDARPWMAEPYLYRAIAKISLDDYQGAIDDASACIERNPFLWRAYFVRAIARQNLAQYDSAVEDYRSGLSLTPDHEGMRYNLTASLLFAKRYKEAETASEEVLRYAPRNREIYALRAGIALERGDTTLAISRIDEAITRDSLLSMPYRLRATIAANRQAWSSGIQDISRVIAIESTEATADLYANRGIMHYQTNNLRGAMADYTEALKRDPKNKVSLHNRALLRQFVGERSEAIDDWDSLIALEPNNYIARYNRATLCYNLGRRLGDALADLDLVLAQYPAFQEGFLLRSEVRKRLGDRRGAERDYWHAWDMEQSPDYYARARRQAVHLEHKRTRQQEDASIDKYNLLVEASANALPHQTKYTNQARGRVQDHHVQLQPMPIFYPTYFPALGQDGHPLPNASSYAEPVELYNKASRSPLILALQSVPTGLTAEQIALLQHELHPDSTAAPTSTTHLRLAIAHCLMQDYGQAKESCRAALNLAPDDALVHYVYAVAIIREQEAAKEQSATAPSPTTASRPLRPLTADPLVHLEAAIRLAPTFAQAHFAKAFLDNELGDTSAALSGYARALELSPRMAEAYYNRGLLLLKQGNATQATGDLSRAGQLGLYQAYSIIKQVQK